MIYLSASLVLFAAGSVNFIQKAYLHAQGNDECAWLRQPKNDSIAVIDNVLEGGVADEAGIRNLDTLLQINGRSFVYNQAQELINHIRLNDYAVYTIKRGTETLHLRVRIVKVYNLFTASLFVTGLLFLLVGLLSVLSKPKGELQQRFMHYCLANAYVFTLGSGVALDVYGFSKVQVIAVLVVVLLLLVLALPEQILFFSYFPRTQRKPMPWWGKPLVYTASLVCVLSQVFGDDGIAFLGLKRSIITQIILGLGGFLTFSFYPTGLGILTQTYFSDLNTEQRKPIRPIIFAFCISIISLVVFTITVQSVPFALFLRPELSLPFLLFASTPIAIAYSIFRYGLMDLGIIIERSLIFAIATAVLAVLYFVLVSLLSSVLGGYMATAFGLSTEHGNSLWVTVTAFVVLGLAFDPVKRRTEDWVARVFYQERINYQKALLELSRELPGLINFDQIVETLKTRLEQTMHLERVLIYVSRERYAEVLRSTSTSSVVQSIELTQAQQALFSVIQSHPIVLTIGHHESEYLEDAVLDELLFQDGLVLAVPMMLKSDVLGMIAVGKKKSGKGYSKEDVDLLQTIASQAAIAFENARLHETEIQKQKMEDSLAIARRIQQSLLPQHSPSIRGLDASGMSIPAEIVGGDFFDLIELSPRKLLVVVGDVSGKGISAALYMSKIQGMMQLAATRYESPSEMLSHLNTHVYGSMERNSYVTMALALFDLEKKELRFCRCGHTKPLLQTKSGVQTLESRGLGVGLCSTDRFSQHLHELNLKLEVGQRFLFYSDGLNEAMNSGDEQFGDDRVAATMMASQSSCSQELLNELQQSVDAFRHKTELFDDLTMVVVHVTEELLSDTQ